MIVPGQTIGILGGGQLGRMMILEGRKMGYRFITLDPSPDCPGSQVADHHIVGEYHDADAVEQLAERSDVVLYEFENIDPQLVKKIQAKVPVPQGHHLLEITRHRLHEKQTIEKAGVPVTPYRVVETKADLSRGLQELGFSAVLKTTTGGYDGKGQWMLRSQQDVEQLPDSLFEEENAYILEQFVPFEKELSVVVARSRDGEVKVFPPAVNLHRNHILHMSAVPASMDEATAKKAEQVGKQVASQFEVVGLLAVEMFLLPDGRIFVNETAPRPHNSGHYTYDACQPSQFEQIIRAGVGLPLHEPQRRSAAVMVNLLGEHQSSFLDQIGQLPDSAKVHWYGKLEAKKGRKMGHITFVGESLAELIAAVEQTGIWPPLTVEEKNMIFGKGR